MPCFCSLHLHFCLRHLMTDTCIYSAPAVIDSLIRPNLTPSMHLHLCYSLFLGTLAMISFLCLDLIECYVLVMSSSICLSSYGQFSCRLVSAVSDSCFVQFLCLALMLCLDLVLQRFYVQFLISCLVFVLSRSCSCYGKLLCHVLFLFFPVIMSSSCHV